MTLKYILRSFFRRKVRMLIILLSIIFGVGMVVSMGALVETNKQLLVERLSQQVGSYDLGLARTDTSSDQYVEVDSVRRVVRQAVPDVQVMAPCIMDTLDVAHGSQHSRSYFTAFDPKNDALGEMKVISGTKDIGPGRVVVLPATAGQFDLRVGDTLDLYYTLPTPRRVGYASSPGASSSRAHTTVTVVGIVTQQGMFSAQVQDAVIADLSFVQEWLGLPGRARQLLIRWAPSLYSTTDPQTAVFAGRVRAQKIRRALGDEYTYDLGKLQVIDTSQQVFASQHAAINVYGLMSLAVVGLLVRTLIQNNVIENRRDLAVLRILGARSSRLFSMVILEVAVLGIVGTGLGAVGGILLNNMVVTPIIKNMNGLSNSTLIPTVSLGTLLPGVLMATTVLGISALAPARQASATKVMYAINSGAAETIGLDDLIKFRERRASGRLFVVGLALVFAWVFIFLGTNLAYTYGDASASTIIMFGSMLTMIVGMSMIFSVLAVPFERLLLTVLSWIAPQRAFFVSRYVQRGKERNTWLSLMIVLAATLPVFVATTIALMNASIPTSTRLRSGTPINAQVNMGAAIATSNDAATAQSLSVRPAVMNEFKAVPGVGRVVAQTYYYRARTADEVGLRGADVFYTGLSDSLNGLLYPDLTTFWAGGPDAFDTIMRQKNTTIIGLGLAQHLNVQLGDTIRVTGKGLDHTVELRVAGIALQMAGYTGIRPNQQHARSGASVALVSLETFREITHDPLLGKPDPNEAVWARFLATPAPEANQAEVVKALRAAFALKHTMAVKLVEEDVMQAALMFQQIKVLMIGLTVISFITAIFGVFAVIYVAVNSRRTEIGMMKAIGSSSRHLLLTFIWEAVVMSVSAVLAGIAAGTLLGYFQTYSNALMTETPTTFAVDVIVTPLTVVLIVAASIISAALASRGMLRRRAVEILREA